MLGKMVTPHEPPIAHPAGKLFLTGMGPSVTGQFVRSGKALLAPLPIAQVGLLSWKYTGKQTFSFTLKWQLSSKVHII